MIYHAAYMQMRNPLKTFNVGLEKLTRITLLMEVEALPCPWHITSTARDNYFVNSKNFRR